MPEITVEKQNENKDVITFNEPYTFENEEYKEIDLSPVKDLSSQDLINAEKMFHADGHNAMVPEVTLPYLLIVASILTKKPLSFFTKLPAREGLKIKNTVLLFLNN